MPIRSKAGRSRIQMPAAGVTTVLLHDDMPTGGSPRGAFGLAVYDIASNHTLLNMQPHILRSQKKVLDAIAPLAV